MTKENTQISIFDSAPDTKMYQYKMSVEKLQSELSKYGLTPNQSKVFIFLGKYGSKTAPEVCKSLKLPRTETYHLLSSLQNKGIVSATFQHPIKFKALPLDKAIWVLVNSEKERIKGLEKMESDISQLWETIPAFDSVEEPEEDKFQMLKGTNQIHSKITEMTDNFDNEFLILGSEKDFLKLYHGDFLEAFIKTRQNFRLLNACSVKTEYIFDNLDRKNIRKMSKDVKDNLCFILKDNSEMLFFTKNATSTEQFAMWTNSKTLVYSMTLLFESLWNNAKKLPL